MKHLVNIDQADYTVLVFIPDSSSTTGAGKTGLDDTKIDLAYSRVETDNDVTCADVAPAALTALTDAHTDWGFFEVDSANAPGLYRLDIADAVFATGAWSAVVTITDAASNNVPPVNIEFQLVGLNQAVPATDGSGNALATADNLAALATEVGKIPRSDAAITAGAGAVYTQTAADSNAKTATVTIGTAS